MVNFNQQPMGTGDMKPMMLGTVEAEGQTTVYRNYPLPISDSFFQRLVEAEVPQSWQKV